MPSDDSLIRLKAAYQLWHDTKGEDTTGWLVLMADNVRIRSVGADAPGLTFAATRHSRSEAVEYLAAITRDWKMVHWTPDTFVCAGSKIAMFGRCAWTHKRTGKTADVSCAHLWTFTDGKAVEFTEVFDSAKAVAAAT